ncbi:hypothetical protein D3C71_1642100 [compost metagenome]
MYSTFTASTVWNLDTPRFTQRRAPLTLLPSPGMNTTINSAKQPSNSRWLYFSISFNSTRIVTIARMTPMPMNTRWRVR